MRDLETIMKDMETLADTYDLSCENLNDFNRLMDNLCEEITALILTNDIKNDMIGMKSITVLLEEF